MDTPEADLEAMHLLIPRLIGAFQRRFQQDLADFGLTFPQFMTLLSLEQTEGTSRMGSLATAALQSSASMTGIVDRLLERALVERQRDDQDRRSVVVRLTEEGQQVLNRIKDHRHRQVQYLFQQLSPQERGCLQSVLSKMIALLEE
jgi:DNA-binding MarR family transcriptional regulator